MKDFNHLDAQTVELAGIAASIAGACRPCLHFHFRKAFELNCTLEQAKEAVELGKMIKQRPIDDIYEFAGKLISEKSKDAGR